MTDAPPPAGAVTVGPTVASYFRAFSPTLRWTELCRWPPDVFALTNLVLDHTEAYRFAVSPPAGARWPPGPDWSRDVVTAAEEWRRAAVGLQSIPPAVEDLWSTVVEHLGSTLASIRSGAVRSMCEALLTLHAMADETCRGLVWPPSRSADGSFEDRAWELLGEHGSLSNIDAARVRITPKIHSASRGITIRSLSRYLALNYESVDVHWRRVRPLHAMGLGRRDFNAVLVPWPLEIESGAFRATEGPLENMEPGTFGFFRFDPNTQLDIGRLAGLVDAARKQVHRVDAVIFPEAAVEAQDVAAVEEVMLDRGVLSLIMGVREAGTANGLGRNYVQLSLRTENGWERYRQAKHHRWCLDEPQIRQYHLSRALDASKQWWEAIELPARTLEIIDVGGGRVTAPLICEDLARMDEVADSLRRIGPSLVVALLLDGPQLPQRWPCRYATVLADEPGSAVLTLSALGMVARSRPPGKKPSRVVAMWSDPITGLHQIELDRGAGGILIKAAVEPKTVWTADGRRHDTNTPSVSFSGVHQLRASPATRLEMSRAT